MTIFEKITTSPETLGQLLASLKVIESPWEDAFHKEFCAACGQSDCGNCLHETERNNPTWWLVQVAENEKSTRPAALVWRNGRVELAPGIIVPLENPLQVHIRAVKSESPFEEMLTSENVGARLETVWQMVKEVRPDVEISIEIEVDV